MRKKRGAASSLETAPGSSAIYIYRDPLRIYLLALVATAGRLIRFFILQGITDSTPGKVKVLSLRAMAMPEICHICLEQQN